jgi:hypothetical protein
MKKIFTIILACLITVVSFGQNHYPNDPHYNKAIPDKFIEVPGLILMVYLAVHVLLTIIKMFLDNRLMAKMIDKGVSEELIKRVTQRNPTDMMMDALKWLMLLTGLAIGIFIASLFPIGILTIAFIVSGAAVGFLVYFLLLKNKYKN